MYQNILYDMYMYIYTRKWCSEPVFSYNLRYIADFGLVEMARAQIAYCIRQNNIYIFCLTFLACVSKAIWGNNNEFESVSTFREQVAQMNWWHFFPPELVTWRGRRHYTRRGACWERFTTCRQPFDGSVAPCKACHLIIPDNIHGKWHKLALF